MIDTQGFKYGIRSDADRARLRQQNGHYPRKHAFVSNVNIPHMCDYPGCFGTLVAKKPWHNIIWDVAQSPPASSLPPC